MKELASFEINNNLAAPKLKPIAPGLAETDCELNN
jgi:hypothetical protein